jgi:hypothetical protein
MARKLNEGHREPVAVKLIEGLSTIIDKHTDIVSAALRASLERWNIE